MNCCCLPKLFGELLWTFIWILILTYIFKIYFFLRDDPEEWIHVVYRFDQDFLTVFYIVAPILLTMYVLRWAWWAYKECKEPRGEYTKV